MKKTLQELELELYGDSLGITHERQKECREAIEKLIKIKVTYAIVFVLIMEIIIYLIYMLVLL